MNFVYSFLSVFVISLFSLVGVFTVKVRIDKLKRILIYFISFSAGALIAGAFLHMLPEIVVEKGFSLDISYLIILGVLFSFVLEKVIHWHHCHLPVDSNHVHHVGIMSLVGDFLHNFIDGVLIGISFLVDVKSGFAVSIAVLMHEIPQEISDFGILLHSGFSISRALFVNFLVSLSAFLGLFCSWIFGAFLEDFLYLVVAFGVGNFVYIALTDLIPELHKETRLISSLFQLFFFVVGVFFMILIKYVH